MVSGLPHHAGKSVFSIFGPSKRLDGSIFAFLGLSKRFYGAFLAFWGFLSV